MAKEVKDGGSIAGELVAAPLPVLTSTLDAAMNAEKESEEILVLNALQWGLSEMRAFQLGLESMPKEEADQAALPKEAVQPPSMGEEGALIEQYQLLVSSYGRKDAHQLILNNQWLFYYIMNAEVNGKKFFGEMVEDFGWDNTIKMLYEAGFFDPLFDASNFLMLRSQYMNFREMLGRPEAYNILDRLGLFWPYVYSTVIRLDEEYWGIAHDYNRDVANQLLIDGAEFRGYEDEQLTQIILPPSPLKNLVVKKDSDSPCFSEQDATCMKLGYQLFGLLGQADKKALACVSKSSKKFIDHHEQDVAVIKAEKR